MNRRPKRPPTPPAVVEAIIAANLPCPTCGRRPLRKVLAHQFGLSIAGIGWIINGGRRDKR